MRTFVKLAAAGLALAGAWGYGASACAVEPARVQNSEQGEAKVALSHTLRTNDIIGLSVKNNRHEDLGKIDDLVIDMKSGEVRYAAVSFGGIAGFGGKLFAVPWQSMTFMYGEPNKANSRHFMFDVTKEQLENAPGFDSARWPNVADPKWAASIDQHYKVQRTATLPNNDEARQAVAYETVFRASKIKGMDVRNNANEDLGAIDELVIDVTKGHVKYLALSFGSWFTGGNKLFAVPLSSCTLTHANDKTYFVIHVSQDSLKNAPGFDKNHWPNTADPNWAKSIDTFYERSAQRPATRQ
jgi:sporulation protein YlmC with PRC-barrel domain